MQSEWNIPRKRARLNNTNTATNVKNTNNNSNNHEFEQDFDIEISSGDESAEESEYESDIDMSSSDDCEHDTVCMSKGTVQLNFPKNKNGLVVKIFYCQKCNGKIARNRKYGKCHSCNIPYYCLHCFDLENATPELPKGNLDYDFDEQSDSV